VAADRLVDRGRLAALMEYPYELQEVSNSFGGG